MDYIKVKIEITENGKGDKIIDTQTMTDDFKAQLSGLIDSFDN